MAQRPYAPKARGTPDVRSHTSRRLLESMISLVPSAQLLVASLIGMPKVAPVQLALYNAMLERLVSTLQVGGLSAQPLPFVGWRALTSVGWRAGGL